MDNKKPTPSAAEKPKSQTEGWAAVIRNTPSRHSGQAVDRQEWTPEYVAGLMARSPLSESKKDLYRAYCVVSDAHNAELAAGRQHAEKAEHELANRKARGWGRLLKGPNDL